MTQTRDLRTGSGQVVAVVIGSIEEVKPDDCGFVDESWFVAQCPDGRWVAITDFASQDAAYFATKEDAERYWEEAAEVEREVRHGD